MLRNKLVRSDGSIIDSSVIISCEFTEEVNSSENLSVGDVTSSEISLEILSAGTVEQDEVLTYYIIEDGVETKIGVFNAEKPTVASRTSLKFSAYDNVIKLEKVFSGWLRDNQNLFPMTLGELVSKACEYCGVDLVDTSFPMTDVEIGTFYADDITCRQVLAWAGAIAGRFVKANQDGKIEFAWYADASHLTASPSMMASTNHVELIDDGAGNVTLMSDEGTVNDDGNGNVVVDIPSVKALNNNGVVSLVSEINIAYKQGGLSYESYYTDPIQRVQIKQTDDDIGVIYPADATGNCFTVRGNMLLATCGTDVITQVAMYLYNQLNTISYAPAKISLLRTIAIRAGDIIRVRDPRGVEIMTYVMKMSVTPSGTDIESTGDKSYEGNAAVSSEQYSNLSGKILEIKKSIDGLTVKNEDLAGKVSGLEMDTESLRTYVENTFVSEGDFSKYRTEVEQTAKDITARFESVEGSIKDTTAHIKAGVLDTVNGTPIYGMEIGQRSEVDGVETFDKYARFTSEKLSFYDSNGNEVSYISDKKQYVTHTEVTGSSKLGGFVDTVLSDGSVVTKWVGGA